MVIQSNNNNNNEPFARWFRGPLVLIYSFSICCFSPTLCNAPAVQVEWGLPAHLPASSLWIWLCAITYILILEWKKKCEFQFVTRRLCYHRLHPRQVFGPNKGKSSCRNKGESERTMWVSISIEKQKRSLLFSILSCWPTNSPHAHAVHAVKSVALCAPALGTPIFHLIKGERVR